MVHFPSIQTLRAFEAAGRLQSYSAAARELGLTHSAISHRIRALETGGGQTLFQRAGNRMIPTGEGHRLLVQVRAALGLLEQAFPGNAPNPRRLVLDALPAFAARWLAPRLGAFRSAHPDVELELRALPKLTDLAAEGIDAAIRYGPGDWPNLQATPLARERIFPVCAPAYRERHGIELPEDLARLTLLRNPWQPWTPWFQAAGLAFKEPATGSSYADAGLLLQAAAAGEGVALARGLLARDDLATGRLVRPFEVAIWDRYGYFLVRPLTAIPNPALAAFERWLSQAIAVDAAERG
ncbi:MAG TPA: LysR substrate-binding domain-containing protein [Aliidongia sp.]|uniref:LysR substrate-binding domain-containing protein n=1 Tax=Aliidongia sp. TaxID=1914230 RepID=UPI002DDCF135|nr:LysR substrate-binding domain-containing protein [Aliidongia sp.]HEV2673868.1 LysR substrate-binding domain-containing protein [Aliidongia sp.]